jgi:hypothetical protein
MPQPSLRTPNRTSPASAIRRANAALRMVLLENEVSDELVGCVAEGVTRVAETLDGLAGKQELFEMWQRMP